MRRKFINFMKDINGVDDLYKCLFIIYFILIIINLFINSIIISYVEFLVMVVMFYRFFSKNKYQRRRENNKYLKYKNKITSWFSLKYSRFKDYEYVYKKCHYCKQVLKLPVPTERGIKHVNCPKCKKRNTFLIFKKLKIEVIKNKERK